MSLRQNARLLDAAMAPKPMHDLFVAWRHSGGKAVRIAMTGTGLSSALQSAQLSCGHKDKLFILQTDRRSGAKLLHCYTIRQGARQYRGVEHGYVCPLSSELLFAMPVVDFSPDEPWQWSPGADVVGLDRSLVEVRP